MKQLISLAALLLAFSPLSQAADYKLDIRGAHAFVNFKIKHLGYSWLTGRFNKFDGEFSYDAKDPAASKISVVVDTASIDSNHAERDKHLRGKKFLDVGQYPQAKFESTSIQENGDGNITVTGSLTLHGVTKTIVINAHKIGEGKDPWGGYRAGFSGSTTLTLEDYGIKNILGPASAQVELELHIEGIRK